MTKKEAIEKFVETRLDAIPMEWVQIVADKQFSGVYAWPMWGTMWFIDRLWGETLISDKKSRVMVSSTEEIDLDTLLEKKRYAVEQAIAKEDWSVLEEYIDEEMAGARCILDKNGNTTALFIYEIEGEYLIGINGAGWNFYDGAWDKLYDTMGLKWHDDCEIVIDSLHDAQAHCRGCGWHYAFTGCKPQNEIEDKWKKAHTKLN